MIPIVLALVVLLTSAGAVLLAPPRWSDRIGTGGVVIASLGGLLGAGAFFCGFPGRPLNLPWPVPLGSLRLELDALSAFFLLPLFLVALFTALYSPAYLKCHGDNPDHRSFWAFTHLLLAAMTLVVLARDAVFFLIAWETMAISSFLLVMHEGDRPGTVTAGWSYLIASQVGTALLIVFFLLLGQGGTDLSFTALARAPHRLAGTAFLLALIGFGTKAGFAPLHVWLPEAHPAAPSPTSALMSGVMIKMGIYGVLRAIVLLAPLPSWCGYLLIAVGIGSGLTGVVFALAQHRLKRLLAYSSVENVGIIAIGLGLGLVGLSAHLPVMAACGFAGALFHLFNHALFKSLLFMGAGSLLATTSTDDLNRLGGLLRAEPRSGRAFLAGALSISGLPPFNGFAGEFLLLFAAFQGVLARAQLPALTGLATVASLGIIGGLALACFSQAFSTVYLGTPRDRRITPTPLPQAMVVPMEGLALLCLLVGLAAPFFSPLLAPVLDLLGPPAGAAPLSLHAAPLGAIAGVSLLSLALAGAFALVRRRWLRTRPPCPAPVWGCGFTAPSPRMQTSSTSFCSPMVAFFSGLLKTRRSASPMDELYPDSGSLATDTPDTVQSLLIQKPATAIWHRISHLRRIQSGHMHLYILYIALMLILLLLWKLGGKP